MPCNMWLEAFAVFRAKNATDHEICALSFPTEITSTRFLTQRKHKRLTPTPTLFLCQPSHPKYQTWDHYQWLITDPYIKLP